MLLLGLLGSVGVWALCPAPRSTREAVVYGLLALLPIVYVWTVALWLRL